LTLWEWRLIGGVTFTEEPLLPTITPEQLYWIEQCDPRKRRRSP
jgi:hypothetical protein